MGCERKQQGTCPVLKNNKKVTSPSKIGLLFGYENFKENELGATSTVDYVHCILAIQFERILYIFTCKELPFEKKSRQLERGIMPFFFPYSGLVAGVLIDVTALDFLTLGGVWHRSFVQIPIFGSTGPHSLSH